MWAFRGHQALKVWMYRVKLGVIAFLTNVRIEIEIWADETKNNALSMLKCFQSLLLPGENGAW